MAWYDQNNSPWGWGQQLLNQAGQGIQDYYRNLYAPFVPPSAYAPGQRDNQMSGQGQSPQQTYGNGYDPNGYNGPGSGPFDDARNAAAQNAWEVPPGTQVPGGPQFDPNAMTGYQQALIAIEQQKLQQAQATAAADAAYRQKQLELDHQYRMSQAVQAHAKDLLDFAGSHKYGGQFAAQDFLPGQGNSNLTALPIAPLYSEAVTQGAQGTNGPTAGMQAAENHTAPAAPIQVGANSVGGGWGGVVGVAQNSPVKLLKGTELNGLLTNNGTLVTPNQQILGSMSDQQKKDLGDFAFSGQGIDYQNLLKAMDDANQQTNLSAPSSFK